ncbi:unnamed protein product [Parnassius apollo]|uniref:(apollo) hypothetical protein n=1 Tax=Parnassius apollo TaxID=110799 RepID=A0A8S3X0U5_PARAO|nr:unnamed protein product [Parnassius apollo]
MKNDSGKWNHRRTGILDIATSYYKRLYESKTTEDEIDLADTSNIPNILQAEVKKAMDTQKQWTESNIILLYKKGDKHEIGNYRPISLMSNIYKIFAKIILKRIERTLDEQQPIEQARFRKDYSVIDHIHVVREVIEKYNEYQLTYYIAFIDYSKAFDSLLHKNIWEVLVEQGIELKYIRLIKKRVQS